MYAVQSRNTTRSQQRFLKNAAPLLPRYLLCGIVAFFVMIPLLIAFIGGFKTSSELLSSPFSLPQSWQWNNYADILTQGVFWQAIWSSLLVTLATVGLTLIIACPPAFVFARMPFPGREVIFNILLFALLLPFQMAILPLFITMRNLHMLDTLSAVILPQVAFGLPVTTLILRNFFRVIPQELEDATYIDGGTQVDFFWRILLPLARPALAVVSMLTIVGSWNNFLLPLLVLNTSSLWTLPLSIMQYQGEHAADWALIMAFLTLSMIPAIIFYLFAERYLIAGLTAGAVKG